MLFLKNSRAYLMLPIQQLEQYNMSLELQYFVSLTK